MTVKELYSQYTQRISPALSEVWDNDGLMCCPDREREVKSILFALDVTDDVVAHAKAIGADVIISHHPLVFKPVSALTEDEPVSRRLITLIRAGISVFSFHTRLDRVAGGVNDVLARKLHLTDVSTLGEGEASLGRIGTLPEKMPLEEFAEYVKIALGTPCVSAWDAGKHVSRVAVVGGEGKDFIQAAFAAGADTYISGRLGYHAMQDSPINLMEAGHYFTERAVTEVLRDMANEIIPEAKTEIYTPCPLAFY